MDLRYYFFSVHYRTPLKFSWRGLEDAHKARKKIMEWTQEIVDWKSVESGVTTAQMQHWDDDFRTAMNSDLNTSGALGILFDLITWSRAQTSWSHEALSNLYQFCDRLRLTFGCFDAEQEGELPLNVKALLDQRATARKEKDFAASDRLRDEMLALGYEVRDTSEGQVVKKV